MITFSIQFLLPTKQILGVKLGNDAWQQASLHIEPSLLIFNFIILFIYYVCTHVHAMVHTGNMWVLGIKLGSSVIHSIPLNSRAEEMMVQWLRALAALLEDWSFIPSNHIRLNNHL